MAKSRGSGKSSLKEALSSQQSRLKANQKAARAAQASEQKLKVGFASGGTQKAGKRKASARAHDLHRGVVTPFSSRDKILLIGEGNFSFARALLFEPPSSELDHLDPRNVTATALDTEEKCYTKYPDAEANVQTLRTKGAEVLFGVDATKLEKVSALKGRRWDRIVWNFPHIGKGITDQERNILSNQTLILGFLRSAASFLSLGPVPNFSPSRKRRRKESDDEEDEAEGTSDGYNTDGNNDVEKNREHSRTRGTILITLRNVPPYTLWDVPRLAKRPPAPERTNAPFQPVYMQLRSFAFSRLVWKGYGHRMTKGERLHGLGKTGEGGEDRTWEFCLKD